MDASEMRAWIQAASWIAAIIGGAFAIYKVMHEVHQGRQQRTDELRWRKAEAAKALNDQMLDDPPTHAALIMLDWDGREFEVAPQQKAHITRKEMLTALRTTNTSNFSTKEMFIRDSFDNLFYYMGVIEHYIGRSLVEFEDVQHPIDYYVGKLAENRDVFEGYLGRYGFVKGSAFLERFPAWRGSRRTA